MFSQHFFWNKSLLYAFLLVLPIDCLSQTSIVAGGGNKSFGSNGEISYSIGQTHYQFSENRQGSISAGEQQPLIEKATPTRNEILYQKGFLSIKVGPNPTHGTCQISTNEEGNLPFELNDLTGRILSQGFVHNGSILSLENQPQGEYLLKIRPNKGTQNIIVFKIAKN